MDHFKQLAEARKAEKKVTKAEAALARAVEDISSTLVTYEDMFDSKQLLSVFARLDNLLKGIGDMVVGADAVVDPDMIMALRDDLTEYRAQLETA